MQTPTTATSPELEGRQRHAAPRAAGANNPAAGRFEIQILADDRVAGVRRVPPQPARQTVRSYTAVVLKPGPAFERPGPDRTSGVTATIYAHGKCNYMLHRAGLLSIVCPIADGGDIVGLGTFDASPEDVDGIMAADPAVREHVLTYDIQPTWSFPGSSLPG